MLRDLAALTPPLVVCGAFLTGLVLFLRRQLGPAGQRADSEAGPDISDGGGNADDGDPEEASSGDRGMG
jgi:hypothetical protein